MCVIRVRLILLSIGLLALSAGAMALQHDVGHQHHIFRMVLMIAKCWQQQRRIEKLEKHVGLW
jgi:hypothetical protein